MHPPYVVLSWRPDAPTGGPSADIARALRDAGWRRTLGRPHLQVWDRPGRPVRVETGPDDAIVVLGHRIAERFAGATSPATPAQAARSLCADGWGSYVALLRPADAESWWAFRDPSGAMEAYSWRCGAIGILASGLADVPGSLLPAHMAIDWSAIAEFLVQPTALLARTALDGVNVVCPGDAQPIGGGSERATPIWRPTQLTPRRGASEEDWSARLVSTLGRTVHGLVQPYDWIMVEASGGLDSSIVVATLGGVGAAPKVASALHYVGDRLEADERLWAEEVCAAADVPLTCIERAAPPFDPLADFSDLSRDARPNYSALDAARDRDTAERLRAVGVGAHVTGKGGDAIFFQMPSTAVITDLWRDRGWRAVSDPRNAEVARWLRRSVWSVWREALAPSRPVRPPIAPFAGPRLAVDQIAPAHPWLAGLETVGRGKREQVQALISTQAAQGLSRRGQVADLIQPLLAQPMMELCLAIPSWRLVGQGRDRGLAREAFAPHLPASVAQRRSKGKLTSVFARRLADGLPAIREFLLDGVLVDAGLLNARAIDRALHEDVLIERGDGLALFQAMAVESWVRHWQTRIPDAAHAPRRRTA